jgi:hypothetical protein
MILKNKPIFFHHANCFDIATVIQNKSEVLVESKQLLVEIIAMEKAR